MSSPANRTAWREEENRPASASQQGSTPAARTRTRTSSSPMTGMSMSPNRNVRADP
jgi:hypothetical protein